MKTTIPGPSVQARQSSASMAGPSPAAARHGPAPQHTRQRPAPPARHGAVREHGLGVEDRQEVPRRQSWARAASGGAVVVLMLTPGFGGLGLQRPAPRGSRPEPKPSEIPHPSLVVAILGVCRTVPIGTPTSPPRRAGVWRPWIGSSTAARRQVLVPAGRRAGRARPRPATDPTASGGADAGPGPRHAGARKVLGSRPRGT